MSVEDNDRGQPTGKVHPGTGSGRPVAQVRGALAEQVIISVKPQLVTIEEAAAILACTPAAIKRWLFERRLRRVKLGRLTRLRLSDVEAIAEKGLPRR